MSCVRNMTMANNVLVTHLAVIMLCLLQGACATPDLANFRTLEVHPNAVVPAGESAVLIEGMPLRSGQVVVREAASSVSFLMNLMTDSYAPYGHAGILVLEADGAFVYDAFGLVNSRFWEPPTRRLRGRIRRLPLATFLARGTMSAIYEHDNVDLDAVGRYAVQAHKNRLAFDGLFDYRTPEQVYCNEFVAAALQAAGGSRIVPARRTTNPSMNRVMQWLELDAPGFILSSELVVGANEIARVAPHYSVGQIEAHFAYERELHKRFTADQKLGNLFRWTARGPRLRPHLVELHETLISGADGSENAGDWAVETMVRALRQQSQPVAKR